jgi:hypothetical protein
MSAPGQRVGSPWRSWPLLVLLLLASILWVRQETLAAEVPLYASRPVIALTAVEPAQPAWLLIQHVSDKPEAPLSPRHRLVMSQSFGSGRSLSLWHLAAAVSAR